MLDIGQRFSVSELPGIWFFPDSQDATGFYALPAVPRIALDEHGSPQLDLIVYGKQTGSEFVARGGLLTLTTDLQLTDAETRAATTALMSHAGAAGSGARVRLLSPDVVEGQVEAHLADGVDLAGTPSLAASYRCAFNTKLDTSQTSSLRAALGHGLAEARLSYRLQLAPGAASSRTVIQQTTWSNQSDGRREAGSVSQSSSSSSGPPNQTELVLEGPLGPSSGLDVKPTQINL